MLKLNLQYFGHLMGRANSLKKTLIMGKIEGKRRRGQQRMRWLDSITYSMDMNVGKFWEIVKESEGEPGVLQSMGRKEPDTIEWLNNNKTIPRVSDLVGWRQSPRACISNKFTTDVEATGLVTTLLNPLLLTLLDCMKDCLHLASVVDTPDCLSNTHFLFYLQTDSDFIPGSNANAIFPRFTATKCSQ